MRSRRSRYNNRRLKNKGRLKNSRQVKKNTSVKANSTIDAVDRVPEKPIVPYDENLLERSRTQWQFGEWRSLAKLDYKTLQHHPDRAKLALLATAGLLQVGNSSKARKYIRLALDWGVSEKLISQILIATVHDSLGRISALAGYQSRAIRHFESAAAIGAPGCDLHLTAMARASYQVGPLQIGERSVSHPLGRLHMFDSQVAPSTAFTEVMNPTTIIIAGMRHSGSTALYNIVRLALEYASIPFVGGYSENTDLQEQVLDVSKMRLIKTHEFRDDIASCSAIVITTRRDLRDTVASALRRGFSTLKKMGGPVEYAKYNRMLHDVWLSCSNYIFNYERFMDDSVHEIKKLLKFIGLAYLSAEDIAQSITCLPTNQYDVTLLTPDHITDPERNLSYSDTLDQGTLDKINSDHFSWLQKYGYFI